MFGSSASTTRMTLFHRLVISLEVHLSLSHSGRGLLRAPGQRSLEVPALFKSLFVSTFTDVPLVKASHIATLSLKNGEIEFAI